MYKDIRYVPREVLVINTKAINKIILSLFTLQNISIQGNIRTSTLNMLRNLCSHLHAILTINFKPALITSYNIKRFFKHLIIYLKTTYLATFNLTLLKKLLYCRQSMRQEMEDSEADPTQQMNWMRVSHLHKQPYYKQSKPFTTLCKSP